MSSPYYRFSNYLHDKFGEKVSRVSVDAGFSCPNRDGKLGVGGCVFCDNRGFSFNSRNTPPDLDDQIRNGMEAARRRFGAEKFILYFQAYTGTYGTVKELKPVYDNVNLYPGIVGLYIGTRPDCLSRDILALINGYGPDRDVWIELGLQSANDRTLERINRRHTVSDFSNAVAMIRDYPNIKICAHVIIGLPGEERSDIIATAEYLSRVGVDGVKVHPMHVIKGTKLCADFDAGLYKPMRSETYMDLLIDLLERLPDKVVIQRVTADCPREYLAGPDWILDKNRFLSLLDLKLSEQGRYQGRLCAGAK